MHSSGPHTLRLIPSVLLANKPIKTNTINCNMPEITGTRIFGFGEPTRLSPSKQKNAIIVHPGINAITPHRTILDVLLSGVIWLRNSFAVIAALTPDIIVATIRAGTRSRAKIISGPNTPLRLSGKSCLMAISIPNSIAITIINVTKNTVTTESVPNVGFLLSLGI